MKRTVLVGLVLFATASATAHAADVKLQHDSFVSNTAAGFQGGFADGEEMAVKFELAPGDYPVRLLKIEFLFGGATSTKEVVPWVRDATGLGYTSLTGTSGGYPGNIVWESTDSYQITGSNQAMHELDTSGLNVDIPSGPFWVGLQIFNGCSAGQTCFPGPARDNDGISQPNVNAIHAVDGNWYHNGMTGINVNGDWVFRVTVRTQGGTVTDVVADPGAEVPSDTAGADTHSTDLGGDVTVPTLSITEVTPSRATVGQEILIQVRGSGLLDGMTLRLGTTPLTNVVVASPQILNATVPSALAVGVYDLIAQWPDGTLFTFPSAFEVTTEVVPPTGLPPAITSVSPSSGRPGDAITVNGVHFDSALTLHLGSVPVAASAFADGTGAVFTVPAAAAPGTYPITVTNPDGQADTALSAFTVVGGSGGGEDGCGCRAVRRAGGEAGGAGLLGLLVAVGLLVSRRRGQG